MRRNLLLLSITILLFVLAPTFVLGLNDDDIELITTDDGKTITIEKNINGLTLIDYDHTTKEYIFSASPNPKYVFTSWNGLPDGIDKRKDVVRIMVTEDLVISANFTEFIENPDNGDNIMLLYGLFGISLIGLVLTIFYVNRHKELKI